MRPCTREVKAFCNLMSCTPSVAPLNRWPGGELSRYYTLCIIREPFICLCISTRWLFCAVLKATWSVAFLLFSKGLLGLQRIWRDYPASTCPYLSSESDIQMVYTLYLVTYDGGPYLDTSVSKSYHWSFFVQKEIKGIRNLGIAHQLRGMPGAFYKQGAGRR